MNRQKFEKLSAAYREGLEEAVKAKPEEYIGGENPAHFAEVVSKRMMANIEAGRHMSNNYDSPGFRRACKKLGIKHTRKSILEYLEIQ